MPGRQRESQPGQHPRFTRLGLFAALAGLAVALAGVTLQVLPRAFSAAQQHQIMAWEVGARWRAQPAGLIFPAAVHYQLPGAALTSLTGLGLQASRAGIAPQADCAAATDPAVAAVLHAHGCLAVLRATYVDATASMIVTVGIAVFPGSGQEKAAARSLPAGTVPGGNGFTAGVRPVAFPGATARFGRSQRQLGLAASRGPYLVMAAAGYADGRPRVRESADPYALTEMRSLASGVAGYVGSRLASPPPPPACPGAPGC
jgi:hypothetical protein